ncbi:MAG: hypothetical protein ACOX9C_08135 [Kiritimatiellia bacterium]|jgi:hypothetical protein
MGTQPITFQSPRGRGRARLVKAPCWIRNGVQGTAAFAVVVLLGFCGAAAADEATTADASAADEATTADASAVVDADASEAAAVETTALDAAPARRNPFWPVGHVPAAAGEQEVEIVAPLSDEEDWLRTPIGAEEWAAALEALPKPGGMFIGPHPETRERVDKMMLMGRVFVAGQEFTTTNNAVAFTWKVDYVSYKERDYRLLQVSARRIPGGRARGRGR